MANLQLTKTPVTNTAMLIRSPVAEVFEAFIDPDITTKFWFTKGSGKLEVGKRVQWDWEFVISNSQRVVAPMLGKVPSLNQNGEVRHRLPNVMTRPSRMDQVCE